MASISAVLIVKNEKECLAKCLDSVKDADEIIVCDTGSTDNTIEIARTYTDKVFTDYKWNDDFAEARNHAKSKALGDWILSIDADEYCIDFAVLHKAIASARRSGRNIQAINCKMVAQGTKEYFVFQRLFRNLQQIRWEMPVHTCINVGGTTVEVSPEIVYGCSPTHSADPDRSIRMLEKAVATDPSPRNHYYLGRDYWYRSRFQDALKSFSMCLQHSNFPAERADAFLFMARAFRALNKIEEARRSCLLALVINANFKEALLFMASLSEGVDATDERWSGNALAWKRFAETATNEDVLFVRNP